MKRDEDYKLKRALATWQVKPPPIPDFKAAVWRRIAAEEERAAAGISGTLREWLFVQLPRPAYATALLAMAVTVGIFAANARAEHARAQYRLDSARQYLASIDPIAMSAIASRLSR